jgi:hypothetical protein
MADRALIDEIRCARRAFAAWIHHQLPFWIIGDEESGLTSLESSLDHKPVVTTLSFGTQLLYTSTSDNWAAFPSGVCKLPMRTRSGFVRSEMAVPSDRNSGFERISKRSPGRLLASRMMRMEEAVRQGTVDFSTTIFDEVATEAMRRVQSST